MPLPLNTFLTRLIWLCVGPLVLLAAYLAIGQVQQVQDERDRTGAALAQTLAVAIDLEIGARTGALRMLAQSPLVDETSRWPELYREAQNFRASFEGHVVMADPQMQMLFNTRVPFGQPLPNLPRPKGHAAAPTAMATGQPSVGDVFVGPIAKEALVAMAVPAMRQGRPAYLMLSVFEARQFQKQLDQMPLPAGWAVQLVDGQGASIARRAPAGLDSTREVDPSKRFVAKSARAPWSVIVEIPQVGS